MTNMTEAPNEKMMRRRQLWISLGLSAVSGILIAASMPNFDVSLLGWVALVPLLSHPGCAGQIR